MYLSSKNKRARKNLLCSMHGAHACNPSTGEVEMGQTEVQGHFQLPDTLLSHFPLTTPQILFARDHNHPQNKYNELCQR